MKKRKRQYLAGIEFAGLVQRLEYNLFSRKSLVIEGRLDGVKVVSTNSHEVTTTANIEM